MARYEGDPGQTRKERVHYICPCETVVVTDLYRCINVSSDPDLARRFLAASPPKRRESASATTDDIADPGANSADSSLAADAVPRNGAGKREINRVRCPGLNTPVAVDVSVLYHDPDNEVFVLVMPESMRHRGLSERAELVAAVAADTSQPVPQYVLNPKLAFGVSGLRRILERAAEHDLSASRDTERRRTLTALEASLDDRQRQLDEQASELARLASQAERSQQAADSLQAILGERESALNTRSAELERRTSELAALRESLSEREVRGIASQGAATGGAPDPDVANVGKSISDSDHDASSEPVFTSAARATSASPALGEQIGNSAVPVESFVENTQDLDLQDLDDLQDASSHRDDDGHEHRHDAPGDGADVSNQDSQFVTPERSQVSRDVSCADIESVPLEEGEVHVEDQMVSSATAATLPAANGVGNDSDTRIGGTTDVAIERWIVSREKYLSLLDDAGNVRLAICAPADELESLAGEHVGLKLQLHRLPSYALVTMSFGTPAMVRGESGMRRPSVFFFDPMAPEHRRMLEALCRDFTLRLELFDSEYLPVRARIVSAELKENVSVILSAADEHVAGVDERHNRQGGPARSFDRAIIAFDDPGYDRLGTHHPDFREFREDKLRRLEKPSEVRRALAIARRFSTPEIESYLVLLRGYSLGRWRRMRRAVLERACEIGLWMGTTLSVVAVSEELARSRKDLIARLQVNFAHTVADGRNDLDDEATQDIFTVLAEQAAAFESRGRRTRNSDDSDASLVSGSIGTGSQEAAGRDRENHGMAGVTPAGQCTVEQLIAQLEQENRRTDAAVELATRGEEMAVGPVFNTLRRMTRREAGHVLGFSVGFGAAAIPHLLDGLRSRKAYLRQGCTLALAVIGREAGNDAAIEAVCDQLIAEPTPIWQEMARALGRTGSGSVGSLVARLNGQDGAVRDRIAWGLAHLVANGNREPIEFLTTSSDEAAAAAARQALEYAGKAASGTRELLDSRTPREQTVNRAFSRSFFEALEGVRPGAALSLEHIEEDLSGPAMLLDEADLLEAADLEDADLLDESDLIPTG